jgi:hypothetical protein
MREEAARRLGFPCCPKCKRIGALDRKVLANEGTSFELAAEWCSECLESLRELDTLNGFLEQLDEVNKVLDATSRTLAEAYPPQVANPSFLW